MKCASFFIIFEKFFILSGNHKKFPTRSQALRSESCPGFRWMFKAAKFDVWDNSTAPTWKGDLNFSKRGPKGDLILSEKGTKRGPLATEKGTKRGLNGDLVLKCVYLINGPKRANTLK